MLTFDVEIFTTVALQELPYSQFKHTPSRTFVVCQTFRFKDPEIHEHLETVCNKSRETCHSSGNEIVTISVAGSLSSLL